MAKKKSSKSKDKDKTKKSSGDVLPGVGLDVGTMNLVSARKASGGGIRNSNIRDAFIDLEHETKKLLKMSGTKYFERDDDIIVVGDAALKFASMFNQEVRRPLSDGLISSSEVDSLEILGVLVRSVLGDPVDEDEVCYFSVPAEPVDADRDIIYHTRAFEKIIEECGYLAYPSNEAMAIIYAETAADDFSGIAISFGSGMTNVALAVNALSGMEFSIARGGDWIDSGAAKSIGANQARLCTIKEKGINLLDPTEGEEKQMREREALSFYYKELIDYTLKSIAEQFRSECTIELSDPIPMVVSGGTSKAGGFMDLFEKVFKKHKRKFPVPISEIRHAKDPLNAVAHGLLVQAQEEYSE